MKNTKYFFDQFHLNQNLEKSLLSRWNEIKPYINSMFRAKSEDKLITLHQQAITSCGSSNSCVSVLAAFYDKNFFLASYIIDSTKGTFGLRGSSYSGSNHSSVIFLA